VTSTFYFPITRVLLQGPFATPQRAEGLRAAIARRTLDAVPGHGRLVDAELVRLVQRHGQTHFLPLARPEILDPP
jgi:hypothetical protein